jgi:histidyl-tRNA synthetase
MQLQALPGFRDFFPAEHTIRSHIFAAWRSVATRYGFEEYDGPPLEPLELYTAKSGDEIVGQLYNFEDKGGRQVSLRPEMTPTLARMVAARANGLRKPIRWFSIPQLFRYERQQRGRLREHFQLNCDLMGEAGPGADAEIIALAVDVMRALGLGPTDFKVRLSDRRILDALLRHRGQTDAQVAVWRQVLDKFGRTPVEVSRQKLRDAGVSEADAEAIIDLAGAKTWEPLSDPALTAASAPLLEVVRLLDAMGLGEYVEPDFTIVRGLAYYTGTVFELFDTKGELRAICGGGRYDNLVGAIGGVDLPCVGFGMGDVVLGELLKERGLLPSTDLRLDVFVAAVSDEDRPEALALVHQLRDAGISVEYALASQALGKQLKQADARGARCAVVIGPDDRARGEVQIKDLAGHRQLAAKRPDAVDAVTTLLAG